MYQHRGYTKRMAGPTVCVTTRYLLDLLSTEF